MANQTPAEIDRQVTLERLRGGAQLVEVLSEKQYRKVHLPGAINIPLAAINPDTISVLKRDRPVVVYCYDTQ
jgi:rhodanese-related sulfurtransferase